MTHNNSSNKQNWRTPKWLVKAVEKEAGFIFTLDAAADDDNYLFDEYYTSENSFLDSNINLSAQVWCNPPFDMKDEFIDKFINDNLRGALLLPSDTGSKWFQKAYEACSFAILLTGRISFLDEDNKAISGNPAPSVIFCFTGGTKHGYQKHLRFLNTQQLKKEHGDV